MGTSRGIRGMGCLQWSCHHCSEDRGERYSNLALGGAGFSRDFCKALKRVAISAISCKACHSISWPMFCMQQTGAGFKPQRTSLSAKRREQCSNILQLGDGTRGLVFDVDSGGWGSIFYFLVPSPSFAANFVLRGESGTTCCNVFRGVGGWVGGAGGG